MPATPKRIGWVLLALLIIGFGLTIKIAEEVQPPHYQAKQQAAEKPEKISPGDRAAEKVANYTLVLAIFTGLLVVVSGVQIRFLIRAGKTARIAAEAAERTAKAAIGIELPILSAVGPQMLFIHGYQKEWGPDGGVIDKPQIMVVKFTVPPTKMFTRNIVCSNQGRTPAFIERIELGRTCAHKLSETPSYSLVFPCKPGDKIAADGSHFIDTGFEIALANDQINAMKSRSAGLWLYGRLIYRDFLKEPHEFRFCWEWGLGYVNSLRREYHFVRASNPPSAYTGND